MIIQGGLSPRPPGAAAKNGACPPPYIHPCSLCGPVSADPFHSDSLPLSSPSFSGLPMAEPAATWTAAGTRGPSDPLDPWRRTTGDRGWGSGTKTRPATPRRIPPCEGVPRLLSDGRPRPGLGRRPGRAGAAAQLHGGQVSETGGKRVSLRGRHSLQFRFHKGSPLTDACSH